MNTLSEFSACFLSDLHCRKSFLVLGTMLVNVTVEINRHEQCDSHDPASIHSHDPASIRKTLII